MRNRVERFFRYLSIPPQAKRKRPHTGNKQPKTIPNPIHIILSGCEDREVSENAYLDTIIFLNIKAKAPKISSPSKTSTKAGTTIPNNK